MKKVVVWFLAILLLFCGKEVSAKDTIYPLNKYKEEEYQFILNSNQDNSFDGFIVAGTYIKKENQQVIIVKYKKDGSIAWEYSYGDEKKDELYGLVYSYDENNKINGYILVVKGEDPLFVFISLEGEFQQEIPMNLGENIHIHQVKMTPEGYAVVGKQGDSAFLATYNSKGNQLFKKDYVKDNTSQELTEVISLKENYYAILKKQEGKKSSYQLLKINQTGNIEKIIKEDFEEKDVPHLLEEEDSYLVYGITQEVKLSEKEAGSYYVCKYNKEDTLEWETVGDTPIQEDNTFQIQKNLLKEEENGYLLLLNNKSDNSIEVIRLDADGLIQEKVKKMKNDYYMIHEFTASENIIYFVGQINCPENDNCDYDAKALFLISSEDKVIEVKDTDSKTILIITGIIVLGVIVLYGFRKKRQLGNKKKR
ncbi:MAG: hypothetical protein J6X28_00395 [Bacilli bacterium]|nr:hypothetical protein [Bacilli bacterium]